MLWDEEAIKRRWSKSSRNRRKKVELTRPATPTSTTNPSQVRNQSECQVLTQKKKSRRQAQCSTPAHLLKQKKTKTTTTTPPPTTTTNNNQQQQTAPFARSRTERKRSLPAPCSLPTKAETKQEARAPHREPGTTDAPP